jgi:hypothetical protein
MFRFPFQRLVWRSALSLEQARESLLGEFSRASQRVLRGSFRGDEFRCVGLSSYRNRFSPIVSGRLVRDGAGTRVELAMRMPWPTIVFLAIYFVGLLLALVAGVWRGLFAGRELIWLLALPLLLFGGGVTAFGFGVGAAETENALKRCLLPTKGAQSALG